LQAATFPEIFQIQQIFAVCVASQKVRDHWEDLDVGGWAILKWIFEKDGMVWIGLIWLRIGTSGGLL
jgi:hypothetical protein